jgi:predicted PurR-regulated permease PerM
MNSSESRKLHRYTLAGIAIGITCLFLWMIREFLVALLLAALLTGLFHPLYGRIKQLLNGRRATASAITVLIVSLLVVVPVAGFLALVTREALNLIDIAQPWLRTQLDNRSELSQRLLESDIGQMLAPYQDQLLQHMTTAAGTAGSWLAGGLSSLAQSTLTFVVMLFVMLYALFFFLKDGKAMLYKILYYLPLPPEDENRMLEKFVSVTRATIKGTLVIGAVQGALGGVGLAAAGVEGAVVWGTIMAVLSVIPGIGPMLIWFPVVVYLLLVERYTAGVLLLIWCIGIVSTVDNLMRPRLVGRDTEMSDLLVLLSTLGGIILFGAAGIVVGPLVAALFVTVWDLYGVAFRDILPQPDIAPSVFPTPPPGRGPSDYPDGPPSDREASRAAPVLRRLMPSNPETDADDQPPPRA